MTLQGYQFDKAKVTPESDAQLYSYLAQGGLDNKVASGMAATSTGLNIYVATGKALVQGRWIAIQQQEQLSAQANTSGYVAITIDLTQPNTATGTPGTSDYAPVNNQLRLELVAILNQQNLSNDGLIYTFPIYSYSTTGTSVTLTKLTANYWGRKERSFNLSYGITANITRVGNMVELMVSSQAGTVIPTGIRDSGNSFPAGYRPHGMFRMPLVRRDTGASTMIVSSQTGAVLLINYTGSNIPTTAYLEGTAFFFTDDPMPN